jgi:hypothetical protein
VLLTTKTLMGHSGGVVVATANAFAFTGSLDAKAMAWRLDDAKCVVFFSHPTQTVVQHAFPLGHFAVTSASDGFVRVWGMHPRYPRSERGYAPLIMRLDPPAAVALRRATRILHVGVDFDSYSLLVVWLCEHDDQDLRAAQEPESESAGAAASQPKSARIAAVHYPPTRALVQDITGFVALLASRFVLEQLGDSLAVRRRILQFLFPK